MTDEQIRQILVERKRQEKRMKRREDIIEGIGCLLAWSGLFFLMFMLSVIGG